jgi:hypothetical protein
VTAKPIRPIVRPLGESSMNSAPGELGTRGTRHQGNSAPGELSTRAKKLFLRALDAGADKDAQASYRHSLGLLQHLARQIAADRSGNDACDM